ncbi:MAG: imidazole glycerol phosphate synthase subunit HisF [Candidatus Marinimicrobia bacterium]|nr:imidazole glycerol phosphate synthase subunit HisF [Candidatus Neomarinimicrobiota bacterium]
MLTKRIIPCLDVKDGEVVKGVHFVNLTPEGDPVELASKYSDEGADELVFLDITATLESRKNVVELVKEVAKSVFIPFTVGGGIRSLDDISELLDAGADKVSINSAALKNPDLLNEASRKFGAQCIMLAVDVKFNGRSWNVHSHGGSKPLNIDAIQWIKEGEDRGAGEILLTSMDADGTQSGIDLVITQTVSQQVSIPVIASGGIGTLEHFKDAFEIGLADAVLAASVFHRDILPISKVKNFLKQNGLAVR